MGILLFYNCVQKSGMEYEEVDSLLIINEINYNSAENFNTGDWVELYNHSSELIELENYYFMDNDDNHIFYFPEDFIINSGSLVVLCSDTTQFKSKHPEINNFLGNLGFSFNGNGEMLRLFNSNNNLIDWVDYGDSDPWPSGPDGNGPTLELNDPFSDNSLPENWVSSDGYGSPGEIN